MTAVTYASPSLSFSRETLLRATFSTMLALGCVTFIEPSPYEMFFVLLIPVAVVGGLAFTRVTLFMAVLLGFSVFAELFALVPYVDAPPLEDGLRSTTFTASSVYLWFSALLFALIFSRHTHARVQLALKAYAFSCVFAGCWSILSYFNVYGIGDNETINGRIAGPFKDPNVLGSYCVLGVAYFTQALILSPRSKRLINLIGGAIVVNAVFLSFSRGSTGAVVFSVIATVTSTYLTADNRAMRRRIVNGAVAMLVLGIIGVGVVASNSKLRDSVVDRAQLEQDYDRGETGRFGNQRRSLPRLVELPFGFGPHRFVDEYHLDSHNSFVGAFSSGGWLGGCAFISIVFSTAFLALRLMVVPSPYRRQAQLVAPALISLFLQAMQIDIDHWRFVFLMFGLIWGMEAARLKDKDRQEAAALAGSDRLIAAEA